MQNNPHIKSSLGFIGAGKVGSGLTLALHQAGWPIACIVSRSMPSAQKLATTVQTDALSEIPQDINNWPDCWIVAVNDDQIGDVLSQLATICTTKPVFHTSGSFQQDSTKQGLMHLGSLYPLQSFSFGRVVDISKVPFCIHSDDESDIQLLKSLATSISDHVYVIKDEDRAFLHLAAVYVNNFTNAMCQIASEILNERQLPFDLLQPLLLETAEKLELLPPSAAQTGPAMRNDQSTIERHRNLLEHMPESYRQIYELLTLFIQSNEFKS